MAVTSQPPVSGHRSGFVAICGRPNVGKSTLLNALMGSPLAVVSKHPQTTRERLLGIWTQPTFQAALVDTPGIHRARSALNKFMVEQAIRGARDVDVILVLAEVPALATVEAAEQWTPGEVALEGAESLVGAGPPALLVLTKTDRLVRSELLLPVVDAWTRVVEFAATVPVSAHTGLGLSALEAEVVARLPEGPPLYPSEDLTDRNMRWHAAELVRAELFEQLSDELPYSCAVVVESFVEREGDDIVRAVIYVERSSQRGMVIGRQGRRIKALSMAARKRIADLTGRGCQLFLSVEVAKNWTRDPAQLDALGYRDRPWRPR